MGSYIQNFINFNRSVVSPLIYPLFSVYCIANYSPVLLGLGYTSRFASLNWGLSVPCTPTQLIVSVNFSSSNTFDLWSAVSEWTIPTIPNLTTENG